MKCNKIEYYLSTCVAFELQKKRRHYGGKLYTQNDLIPKFSCYFSYNAIFKNATLSKHTCRHYLPKTRTSLKKSFHLIRLHIIYIHTTLSQQHV